MISIFFLNTNIIKTLLMLKTIYFITIITIYYFYFINKNKIF